MTHWGKFADALADLRGRPYTGHERLRDLAVKALANAQRFYLPNGSNVIEGKMIDAEMQNLMRLPFDVTAVVHETVLVDTPERAWVISIGIDTDSDFNVQNEFASPKTGPIVVLSIVHHSDLKVWTLMPLVCGLSFLPLGGYSLGIAAGLQSEETIRDWQDGGVTDVTREFLPDVTAIMNLCALLNTVAKSVRVPAPEKLNRARAKADRPILPDYHVLTVAGDVWDSPHEKGDGPGVRSHLRRGHIRRLDVNRFTWVKSTIVQGRREGFVKKDYIVRGLQ